MAPDTRISDLWYHTCRLLGAEQIDEDGKSVLYLVRLRTGAGCQRFSHVRMVSSGSMLSRCLANCAEPPNRPLSPSQRCRSPARVASAKRSSFAVRTRCFVQIFEYVQLDLKKYMGQDKKKTHLPLKPAELKVRFVRSGDVPGTRHVRIGTAALLSEPQRSAYPASCPVLART